MELKELLERARKTQMSEQDREEQRISFAFGNANFENDRITRETVLRESQKLRETKGNEAEPS